MIGYKEKLGNAHFQFIKGIKGVSIVKFGEEDFSSGHNIYIHSIIKVHHIHKKITSTLNPSNNKISHKVKIVKQKGK